MKPTIVEFSPSHYCPAWIIVSLLARSLIDRHTSQHHTLRQLFSDDDYLKNEETAGFISHAASSFIDRTNTRRLRSEGVANALRYIR
jgi:hypothetical protein